MRHSRALTYALLLPALAQAGCDFHGATLVIEPEFDDTSSFESDLGRWTGRVLDPAAPGVAWEVARSAERATEGGQSARLRLDVATGEAKLILERRYEVERNQRYLVEIDFDVASADFAGVAPWRLVAGAAPEAPGAAASLSTPGDAGNGSATDVGHVWADRSSATEVTSDADGELFVYLGVWAPSPGSRTYYVDDVRVALTRRGITTAR